MNTPVIRLQVVRNVTIQWSLHIRISLRFGDQTLTLSFHFPISLLASDHQGLPSQTPYSNPLIAALIESYII